MLFNRPRDISAVIDGILALNAEEDPAVPLVDEDEIGVLGHSLGGFTALAMASGYAPRPPFTEVYVADPRVKAIVPIAARTTELSDDELSSIDVPTMLIGGTADSSVPIPTETVPAWELLSTQQSYRVDIHDAAHNSFSNACDFRDLLVAVGAPPIWIFLAQLGASSACAPGLIPIDEAMRIASLYTTAFFKKNVANVGWYTRFLTPSYVQNANLPVDYFRSLGGN